MEITPYLELLRDQNGSDLFFTKGSKPRVKVDGILNDVGEKVFEEDDVKSVALEIMDDDTAYIESATLLKGEIYDYILSDHSKAVDIYLNFLELFPQSIYYDLIRLRLRELAS